MRSFTDARSKPIILAVRSLYILFSALLLTPSIAAGGGIDLDPSTFVDEKLGIKLHTPYGWTLHRRSGYPSILATLISPNGRASISLAMERTAPDDVLAQVLARNCQAMTRVGLRVRKCGQGTVAGRLLWEVSALTLMDDVSILQYYFRGDKGIFILTLCTPKDAMKKDAGELFRVLEAAELFKGQREEAPENVIKGVRRTPPASLPIKPPSARDGETLDELQGEALDELPGDKISEEAEDIKPPKTKGMRPPSP